MMPEHTTRVTIRLSCTENAASKLATLLQRGFLVPVTGAVAVAELLTSLPGFSLKYVSERVQTIFVNGLPVDNTARELIAGDTLALSAAMPGLAGAIFRRGGQHASLRTRPLPQQRQGTAGTGNITLKLFNMVATETGPQLLEAGILIRGPVLARFLERQDKRMLPLMQQTQVNGATVPPPELAAIAANNDFIFLTIRA